VNVLKEASDIAKAKWSGGRGSKALIIFAAILASVCLMLWVLGRFIKSLASGGFRNMDLYFPRRRR